MCAAQEAERRLWRVSGAAQEYGTMPRKGGLREDFPFAINTKDVLQDICWDDQEILKILI